MSMRYSGRAWTRSVCEGQPPFHSFMTQRDPDENLDQMINRLHSGLGDRRDPEQDAQPVYGEANPLPPQAQPQTVRLRLPSYRPLFWGVLLAINIGMYLIEVWQSGGMEPKLDVLNALGAKNNELIFENKEYWRLLTAMFLHGGLLHILFNGYALFALGPETERTYGPWRFLAVYFIGGLTGSVASYAFSPSVSVGASGAIFALLGALGAFFYASRKTLGEAARQQLGSLITIAMLNLFIGFSGGNIDNFGHIGGLIGGLVVGWLLAPRYEVDDRLYPPVVVRRFLPVGWAGAAGFLALLAALVVYVIRPAGL